MFMTFLFCFVSFYFYFLTFIVFRRVWYLLSGWEAITAYVVAFLHQRRLALIKQFTVDTSAYISTYYWTVSNPVNPECQQAKSGTILGPAKVVITHPTGPRTGRMNNIWDGGQLHRSAGAGCLTRDSPVEVTHEGGC